MVLASLDRAVQNYCSLGIAQSTRKTYATASRRFQRFCVEFNVSNPFPVLESTLCYFATYLAQSGLAPSSIKVYLAALRHMQVLLGLPEPRAASSLPRLKLVLNGIARSKTGIGSPQRPRLQITIHVLHKLFIALKRRPRHDHAVVCMFIVFLRVFSGWGNYHT